MKVPAYGLALISGIIISAFLLFTYLSYYPYFNSKERLLNYKDSGIILFDRKDTPYYFVNEAKLDNDYVTIDKISPFAVDALLAAEDKEFFEHPGISVKGIARSVILNIQNQTLTYGGSTLTQQLVKNTLLSPKKSFFRKAQEAVLAAVIETKYEKKEILEMYFNTVYFGEGAIGIKEAARVYFETTPDKLTLSQASYLMSIIKHPSLLSPYTNNKELGLKAQKNVLKVMAMEGFITQKEYEIAISQKLSFAKQKKQQENFAPHYSLLVIDKLKELFGNDVIYEGLQVKTSLDLDFQMHAQSAVGDGVAKNKSYNISNGSLVSIVPKTGEVIALVGSSDWYNQDFGMVNMAISPRQPGSSFKPIVYSIAMDNRQITPASILRDTPKEFVLDPKCKSGSNCTYKPNNYDRRFRGRVTVRRALSNSLNVPAVEVMQRVGIGTLLARAPEFGITSLHNEEHYGKGLSLVLGSAEVAPLEMAAAYTTFANEGKRNEPVFILEVKNKFGKVIYKAKKKEKAVISKETAFFINSILSDSTSRREVFGSTLDTPFKAAVKTGTSEYYKDAWTIGYTPDLVTAVWIGNSDASPISGLSGSLAAAPIWKNVMTYYIASHKASEFIMPDSIVQASYCGRVASSSARVEYFIRGTEPTECQRDIFDLNLARVERRNSENIKEEEINNTEELKAQEEEKGDARENKDDTQEEPKSKDEEEKITKENRNL